MGGGICRVEMTVPGEVDRGRTGPRAVVLFHLSTAQKSKSANAFWCCAERLEGLGGGDRTGWRRVKSLSKLLTSVDSLIDGTNGGFTFFARRASQSRSCRESQEFSSVPHSRRRFPQSHMSPL